MIWAAPVTFESCFRARGAIFLRSSQRGPFPVRSFPAHNSCERQPKRRQEREEGRREAQKRQRFPFAEGAIKSIALTSNQPTSAAPAAAPAAAAAKTIQIPTCPLGRTRTDRLEKGRDKNAARFTPCNRRTRALTNNSWGAVIFSYHWISRQE